MTNKIILTGYMACGKTATSKILAQKLNLNILDLDHYIEKKEQISIEKIFETKGEIYFRKQEIKWLNHIIEHENDFVLSLGGGTPCFGENYKHLQNPEIPSFYLQTSVQEIVKRLKYSKQVRPLLKNLNHENWEDFISKHLFERNYYYNFAQYKVNTNNKDNKTVAEEIYKIIMNN